MSTGVTTPRCPSDLSLPPFFSILFLPSLSSPQGLTFFRQTGGTLWSHGHQSAGESGLPPARDQAIDMFADNCVKGGGLHTGTYCVRIGPELRVIPFHPSLHFLFRKDYLPLLDRLKQRSGDLLVEVSSLGQVSGEYERKQAEQLLALQMLTNMPITVSSHGNLNSSYGVISECDLYNVPEQEIFEGLQDQKVCAVRRITIRRYGQVVNTKHLILTFACPDLPQFITAGYLRCSVRSYIPNPLRCFQCQRFGHSKTTCRGKPTSARCSEVGHDSGECNGQEKGLNCKGDHPLYSRSCKTYTLEKEIITVKIKNRLTYPEA
ncbi:uncharacterized protein TNCV_434111 [Trichonephila clavipes]|nr:uncharacterized protein TNCV_434111 [Trichonephila clavipes]